MDLESAINKLTTFFNLCSTPVRDILAHCLCQTMVEAGLFKLIETQPGESGPVSVYETQSGYIITLARPPMDEEQEAVLVNELRDWLLKNKEDDSSH